MVITKRETNELCQNSGKPVRSFYGILKPEVMNMIIRNEHRKQFTKVDTELARNGTFRPEELGLYVTMLSHTDNWDFHEKALARELGTTPEEIRAILLRLEMKGFAVSRTSRYGLTWDLIERPEEIQNDDDFPPQEEDGIWLVKEPHFDAKTHFPSLAHAPQPVQPAIGFLPIQKKSVLIPSSFKAFAASLSAV